MAMCVETVDNAVLQLGQRRLLFGGLHHCTGLTIHEAIALGYGHKESSKASRTVSLPSGSNIILVCKIRPVSGSHI